MFGSLITALPTLFDRSNRIDFPNTKKLLDHLIATGTQSVAVAGSTGEGELLTWSEKWTLFQFVRDYLPKSIKVIATIGGANTDELKHQIRQVNSLKVDGFLVVVPPYVKPTQEGMFQHFHTLSQVSQKPMIIYNVPSRVGTSISGETVVRLIQSDYGIIGLKQAHDDFQSVDLIKSKYPGFLIFSGDDKRLVEMLNHQGDGIISVGSNLFGEWFKAIIQNHKLKESTDITQQSLEELSSLLALESNPIPLKYLLERYGFGMNRLRLPLTPLAEVHQPLLDKWVDSHPLTK